MVKKSLQHRLNEARNPLLKGLFEIIIEKKSNLCVAANFKNIQETLDFIDLVGNDICILKTQCEKLGGNLEQNLISLYEKKKQYNFLLFEDRKFCDGADTVEEIYSAMYVKYVDIVTVMGMCGDHMYKAIERVVKSTQLPADEHRGCLAVCEVSFSDWLPIDSKRCLQTAMNNLDICIGVIAQGLQVPDDVMMIKATPGVHLVEGKSATNQQWNHPRDVVERGADVIIVGRGIIAAPKSEAKDLARRYKDLAFEAYSAKYSLSE